MSEHERVHIGNAHGKIAIWCDEREAIDLANFFGPRDGFYREIMAAIEKAYPKTNDDEDEDD